MRGTGRNDYFLRPIEHGLADCLICSSDDDKTFNTLISRVASIGKLRHKSIGYSGPLSRELLCFHSLIFEVRSTLRDLVEVVLAGMLLSGNVDRDRDDWAELSVKCV